MPCDRRLRPGQTISQRKEDIKQAVDRLNKALVAGRVKVIIGPQGAVAFQGWTKQERSDVGDACAYRRIMATGSSAAKLAIARAEQLSGRSVNKQVIGQGAHSHDGGHTWHDHK